MKIIFLLKQIPRETNGTIGLLAAVFLSNENGFQETKKIS
jgi:hypothetical protein